MLTEVDLAELDQARTAGAYVVDVREPDEYAAGHVPGARLVPLGELGSRMSELPTGEPVYLICGSGGRSMRAAELLDAAGLDARSVAGGTGAWAQSGRPLQTGAADT